MKFRVLGPERKSFRIAPARSTSSTRYVLSLQRITYWYFCVYHSILSYSSRADDRGIFGIRINYSLLLVPGV